MARPCSHRQSRRRQRDLLPEPRCVVQGLPVSLAQVQPPCPADGLGSGLGAGQMLEEPRCQERHKAGNSLTCTCA